MADSKDVLPVVDEAVREDSSYMEEPTGNEVITSSETNDAEADVEVVLMDDQPSEVVSSVGSEVVNVDQTVDILDTGQCTSSDDHPPVENVALVKPTNSGSGCEADVCDLSSSGNQNLNSVTEDCHSDNESEIIVDDSPMPAEKLGEERVVSSGRNETEYDSSKEEPDQEDREVESSIKILGRSRSVTPSPSFIRLATPSTPGTPRLRSGSVSGTAFAPLSPKPSPSARATPAERPRAGSMGEIEMRDKLIGREFRHGVRIIDNLDILQLPRPRNPGGILPESGQGLLNGSNEALNLTIEDRQQVKPLSGNDNSVSSSFSSILPSSMISVTSSTHTRGNTSYLISNIIRSTPNRLRNLNIVTSTSFASRNRGCAINESVERPLPSSIVDNEGVAKKIARLDSEGFLSSSTGDSLWNHPGSARRDDHLSRVRVLSDKTPPERPKPPRRITLSPADNGNTDVPPHRSFVSSSVRRRMSPSQSLPLSRRTPSVNGHNNGSQNGTSPDDEICMLPHHYKCRTCNYSSSSYNMLQVHSSKHGGVTKTFRCSLCDYSTQEKSNFRRHRRLHHKTSPVNVLKCAKCAFMTSVSRKLREHCQHAHPDVPDLAPSSFVSDISQSVISAPRYSGPNGTMPSEPSRVYPGPFYDSSYLLNRADRLSYPYSLQGRQPALNCSLDQYGVPYGSQFRDRASENLASSYLRSAFPPIMNSETSRQAATSTVTSSNYYVPPGAENSHSIQDIHSCNTHGPCLHAGCTDTHGVKIKVETDLDNGSDVSSTAHSGSAVTPDVTRSLATSHTHHSTETIGSNLNNSSNIGIHLSPISRHQRDESAMVPNGSSDFPTDLSRRHQNGEAQHIASLSRRLLQVPYDIDSDGDITNHGHSSSSPCPSNTVVKSDNASRAVQCTLPVIKSDVELSRSCMRFSGLPCFQGVDRAVQCNMSSLSASGSTRSQCHSSRLALRPHWASESDNSQHDSSVCEESRCEFCGISFEDEVLFSIHIGCHSHTDPFKCNVCGKQCGNKYGFYSHIMRGHQM